jgi:hypothetical protein
MKKSLIVTWITACDYPLFRQWLETYHTYFDEIIIYWDVQFRHPFYWAFMQESLAKLPNITFLDPVEYTYGEQDWRNVSTNELLKHATGDWIISIEQDWFCRNWPELFTAMNHSMDESDMFGWWNPTNNPYVHPAFWGIKRALLEKTAKDFSPHPEINGSDHFAKITYDVLALGAKIDKYTGDVLPESLHFHLGGVNQNYLNGLQEGFQFHREEIFYVYNRKSMEILSPMMPLMKRIHEKLSVSYSETWPIIVPRWEKFFV